MTVTARLVIDKTAYENGLQDAEKEASASGGRLSGIFGKIAGGVGTLFKAGAAGIAAGSAAVGVLTKQATGAYADYEQLTGGVKKLFGDASDAVMQYASEAYRTSGLSANKYMEQATSFSAALINSLGGDTQKAAEYADMAMRSMSDNANTFGTDMQAIQNAYQGFSKQNYTMLDNLKLGYGGTKTEMQRLVEDAEALNTGFKAQRDEAGNLTLAFSDVVQAIELIQEKQNIAGTTAKEAATTIEGAFNMTKAAWENLVAGFANPDADMDKLMDNLIVAVVGDKQGEGLLNQLLPAVERALDGIGRFLEKAAPVISKYIPRLMKRILPSLIKAATSLVSSLVSALPSIVGTLIEQVPFIVTSLRDAVINSAPMILEGGIQLANTILNGIITALPQMSAGASQLIESLYTGLMENIPRLAESAIGIIQSLGSGLAENIPLLAEKALPLIEGFTGMLRENAGLIIDAGLNLLLNLAQGIANAIPTLVEYIPQIVINIAGIINDNAPKILETGINIIVTLGKGLIAAIPKIKENIPKIIQAIVAVWQAFNWVGLGKNVINFIVNGIKSLQANLPTLLKNIGEKGLNLFKSINWLSLGESVINFIGGGISSLVHLIPNLIVGIGTTAVNLFTSIDWLGLGSSVIGFIVSGIQNVVSHIPDALGIIAGLAMDTFKNVDWLGVGSTVIDTITDGLRSAVSGPLDFLRGLVDDILGFFDFKISFPSIELPHFSIDWEDVGWFSIPHVSIDWYAKAYDNPWLFTEPTVLGGRGFGDRPGGEIVYGHESLMKDIEEAVKNAGGQNWTFSPVFNIYGNGKSDQELADEISDILMREYLLQRGGA